MLATGVSDTNVHGVWFTTRTYMTCPGPGSGHRSTRPHPPGWRRYSTPARFQEPVPYRANPWELAISSSSTSGWGRRARSRPGADPSRPLAERRWEMVSCVISIARPLNAATIEVPSCSGGIRHRRRRLPRRLRSRSPEGAAGPLRGDLAKREPSGDRGHTGRTYRPPGWS